MPVSVTTKRGGMPEPLGKRSLSVERLCDRRRQKLGQRPYHSYTLSPGGTFRVMSTIIVSPSHRLTRGCPRRWPYRNSSTNSTHRYSTSCALGSRRRYSGIEIFQGLVN